MAIFRIHFWLGLLVFSPLAAQCKEARPGVLAHYMPWYASKPVSGQWGWHWTMDHFDPDIVKWNGRRETASHDYPLIGLYDSSDPDVLECHALLMKFAGLDGAIIDWYGTETFNDYGVLHENTKHFISYLKKAGLKFAVCYEDQSIGAMVDAKHIEAAGAVEKGKEVMTWLSDNWFADPDYLKIESKPVMPVFGPQYFPPKEWKEIMSGLDLPPRVYALPHLADSHAEGRALAWPPVKDGKSMSKTAWMNELEVLYTRDKETMGVAFPGFQDIYAQAGLHKSYGFIDSQNGETLADSLDEALSHDLPLIQIATWNDYGEGTVVEPTMNLGYQYLETIQSKLKSGNAYTSADLRLPIELYELKKQASGDGEMTGDLDKVSNLLFASKTDEAREAISRLKSKISKRPVEPGSKYRLVTEIPYRTGDHLTEYERNRCKLDLYYPSDGKPYSTVVWFHGGGISKGNKELPTPLLNKGIAIAAVNYRMNPGVKEPAYIEDAAASVAWLFQNIHRYGAGSPERIFVSGHSAGGYLASMIGLDKSYLAAFKIDADKIAGLIPFSGHTITHFTVRKERGIAGNQPIVDSMAPLFHIRKDCSPMLLITGDREKELWGRYEENAYFWRMMQVVGHSDVTLRELEGYDHGGMPEPAFPLLLNFINQHSR